MQDNKVNMSLDTFTMFAETSQTYLTRACRCSFVAAVKRNSAVAGKPLPGASLLELSGVRCTLNLYLCRHLQGPRIHANGRDLGGAISYGRGEPGQCSMEGACAVQ